MTVPTTRAVIYARYSSDKQSDRSVEDQVRLCRERADREGWQLVQVYPDYALSGATRDRPGLNALLAAIGDADVVLAESIDRLSRDQEDIAAIWKRLRFAGGRLVTLSEGEVGELHVGLGGTMAALYLKQLGEKTRRGQLGRVEAGRIPGGRSYGYDLVPGVDERGRPDRGRRAINPDEAAIVRRIFAEFLEGTGPKRIAERLNRDRVPSPSGGKWGASTILGNRRRGTGILHNALYAGRLIYNRQRFEKHPDTRKRLAKLNPESEWRTHDVPELAIVDAKTWAAVEARFETLSSVPARQQRRPSHLFSGLIRCGVCQGNYTVVRRAFWGCSGHNNGHGCTNGRTISTAELERRILGALTEDMLAPDVVAEFLREYELLMREGRRAREKARGRLERRLARIDREIERMIDAIAAGAAIEQIRSRILKANADRGVIAGELEELQAENVVALHPNIAEIYRDRIRNLAIALKGEAPGSADARSQIRELVDAIVATPRADSRGLDLILTGRLAAVLELTQKGRIASDPAELTVKMVAGTGFEPVTFRL